MPKHALGSTRDKPSVSSPNANGSQPPSSVQLSNEVLLRAKIAQLQRGRGREASSGPAGSKNTESETRKANNGSKQRPPKASASVHAGSGQQGVHPGGKAGQTKGTLGKGESEGKVWRRFEDQVALAHVNPLERALPPRALEGREQQRHGFNPEGVQILRDMYLEQVRIAKSTNKRADVLSRKTQELAVSSEVMIAEAEHCAEEATRSAQKAATLHTLRGELEDRRSSQQESRKAEAAEENAKRTQMNASLNTVVADISRKIKEQEEERIAQDTENSNIREALRAIIQTYEEEKMASSNALQAQEEELATLNERLAGLTTAAQTSCQKEEELRKEVQELVAGEEVLRRRVGEHASRLQRLEAGLKLHLEAIQRLQTEETTIKIDVARLAKEKLVLLSRAGMNMGEKGGGIAEWSSDELAELVRQKAQRAAELESEKYRLQARCRELQAERKKVTADVESLVAAAATEQAEERDPDAGEACP